ncbi:MAG: hypothetical protein V4497_00250 [Bacteroidota bacterium]
MNEQKIKHLEFIQNTITKMGNNSFLIKGWLISIVSALYALSAKDSNSNFIIISYLAIPVFWLLNGYFLSQERKYRTLYDAVRLKNENQIDFDMNTKNYNNGRNTILSSLFSISIFPLYFTMFIITLIVIFKNT